ncbi:hypothetical protein C8J56DRAFT_1058145 [Mycena floridula]|nr:hypothetical protein C8J56DRAFT_1058145 [Mycena floridula]
MDSPADIEINDVDNISEWHSAYWICKGRRYKDVPLYVTQALRSQCRIPILLQNTLPAPHLPVTDFLEIPLPDIMSEIYLEYSMEPADDITIDLLKTLNPISTKSILLALKHSMGQGFLDGSQSSQDTCTGIKFPLWVQPFLVQMLEACVIHPKWTAALTWVMSNDV